MQVVVAVQRHAKLSKIIPTVSASSRIANPLHSWHNESNQHPDNRYHHQDLDYGDPLPRAVHRHFSGHRHETPRYQWAAAVHARLFTEVGKTSVRAAECLHSAILQPQSPSQHTKKASGV